jgi:hypothetical protein
VGLGGFVIACGRARVHAVARLCVTKSPDIRSCSRSRRVEGRGGVDGDAEVGQGVGVRLDEQDVQLGQMAETISTSRSISCPQPVSPDGSARLAVLIHDGEAPDPHAGSPYVLRLGREVGGDVWIGVGVDDRDRGVAFELGMLYADVKSDGP